MRAIINQRNFDLSDLVRQTTGKDQQILGGIYIEDLTVGNIQIGDAGMEDNRVITMQDFTEINSISVPSFTTNYIDNTTIGSMRRPGLRVFAQDEVLI